MELVTTHDAYEVVLNVLWWEADAARRARAADAEATHAAYDHGET